MALIAPIAAAQSDHIYSDKHVNEMVLVFVNKPETPQFPDRTNEHNAAVAYDKAIQAQKAAEEAQRAAQAAIVAQLPSNEAKAFIYMKESGNNPAAVNGSGCRGLGQACPGSKLPCGNDYACQDAYFTNYAMSRYGSWEGAYQFWIGHHWW